MSAAARSPGQSARVALRAPRALLPLAFAALALAGCAGRGKQPPGVPVDSRPTPPTEARPTVDMPAVSDTVPVQPPRVSPGNSTPPAPPAGTTPEAPPPPVESVVSPAERRQALARIVADTTAAGAAVRRCSGRTLLPDQESVFDTARSLLGQTRTALERDELWRAESLARKARQLASSLNCPG
jgi:hypothetical protein